MSLPDVKENVVDDTKPSPLDLDESPDDESQDLKTMMSQFIATNINLRNSDRLQSQKDLAELRLAIASLRKDNLQYMSSYPIQTPFPDRTKENRRSSMFFGSPSYGKPDPTSRSQIQVLQADIIYDKELKVSSLEGLQYFAKQIALLSSKYPEREIKFAHMVSYNLRPHVVAAWNSHCHKEYLISGIEPEEIMVEDWLSLSNEDVHAILLESARPRTRELYSRELVNFLGKGIPQSPDISSENFNKFFYVPLMKSLNDLLNLHDLLSKDTSNYSNNASKMPSVTYGTRDSPGHVALWIISLGTQKDAILQWLGKDELVKHKTVELAVKYIRSKLMEGRSQSESRQDFDSKLTPIRYEDIRQTQGESYQRQQIQQPTRHSHTNPDQKGSRDFKSRSHLSAIHLAIPIDEPNNDAPQDFTDDYDDADEDPTVTPQDDDDFPDLPQIYQQNPDILQQPIVPTLSSIGEPNTFRSAIAATFRGFCMEKFVFGKCSKQDLGCSFDHSSAGQEKCIQSFNLLSKRELLLHGQLPPWTTTQNDANTKKPFNSQNRTPKPYSPPFTQPRSYGNPSNPRSYNK
jgi:hypothetical protein